MINFRIFLSNSDWGKGFNISLSQAMVEQSSELLTNLIELCSKSVKLRLEGYTICGSHLKFIKIMLGLIEIITNKIRATKELLDKLKESVQQVILHLLTFKTCFKC